MVMLVLLPRDGNTSATVFWIFETAAAHADGSPELFEKCRLDCRARGYCVLVKHQGQMAGAVEVGTTGCKNADFDGMRARIVVVLSGWRRTIKMP